MGGRVWSSSTSQEGVVEVIVERPAALDVHKAQVTACVRVPGEDGRVEQVQEFKTTVRGLLVLRDWLKAHRVTQVTMEATGVISAELAGKITSGDYSFFDRFGDASSTYIN